MEIEVRGSGGAAGWPEPGCQCASCQRAAAGGIRHAPFQVVVDGALELTAAGPAGVVPGYQVRELAGGWDVTAPDGTRLLAGPGPEVPSGTAPYHAVLLDLASEPAQLGRARARGSVTSGTLVLAVFGSHRVRSERELARRCRMWRAVPARDGDRFTVPGPGPGAGGPEVAEPGPRRVLVLGGSGSGKSAEAELRLAAEPAVTYVATGRADPADAEWTARIAAHRARRPAWWRTVELTESAGLARALADAPGAMLVDSVTTWLAVAMDECGAWDGPAGAGQLAQETAGLVAAWRQTRGYVVAVSDETGLGVVPETRAGRLFRDELGRLNQRLAAEADDFTLVVAGRPLVTED